MSTTTSEKPPEPVEVDGPVADEHVPAASADKPPIIENGAISDARRRARKRRGRFAVIVAASAIAIGGPLAAFLIAGAGTPSVAPAADSPIAIASASTDAAVIGRWARIHVGWVYVYDDGRVLSYNDSPPIIVRHLSPSGVDLVREGTIEPEMLLIPDGTIPAAAWSPTSPSIYRPTKYALCHLSDSPDPSPDELADVGLIQTALPTTVRSFLDHAGVQSFTDPVLDENGDFVGIDGHHGAPGPGTDCFVMGPALVRAVWEHTRPDLDQTEDDVRFHAGDATFATIDGTDGNEIILISIPIMPHGGWVLWGG